MSDERPAVTTSAPTHGAQGHAGRERRDDAEKRAQARMHNEREDPGREAHRGREREIDLADGDDEHQRHDQAERDRQGDEDRIVDRPVQEHRGAGRHENRDHRDEHGERAERRAIAVDEAPQRAFGRARDGLGARFDRFERGGHDGRLRPVAGRGRNLDPLRMREPLHIGDQALGRADLLLGRLQRDRAAIHHDETLRDVEDVVDVVADEQDRAAAGAHRAHEAEHLFGFGQRERSGRLVHDDQVRLIVDGARERDPLPLAA